ncbi:MAG: TIGR00730 family Rossman fold protein [Parvibaculaceae bacterium]
MTQSQNLCVYCGSGPGLDPAFAEAAKTLGKSMAKAGIGLVYGGGSLGLMGEVARATLAAGGHVTGIIPDFLVQRERMLTDVNEFVVTTTMHERKMEMFTRSQGFVALPGGIGTLEELVEVSTWAQLGQHNKPIVIVNVNGYWAPLIELLAHMRRQQFIRPGLEVHYEVVDNASDVVPAFRRALKRQPQVEPVKPLESRV